MRNYITQKQLDSALARQTNEFADIMQSFMDQVSDKFVKVDEEFEKVHKRHNELDKNMIIVNGFIH